MIIKLIIDIIVFLIMITLALWIPKFILNCIPKEKKYDRLIKQLEYISCITNKIWHYVGLVFNLLISAFISAFIGIGSKPLIYKINYPFFGETYSLWASYMITGLTFYLLYPKITKENKNETRRTKDNI